MSDGLVYSEPFPMAILIRSINGIKQPHYVEIWIENLHLRKRLKFCSNNHVRIIINRGFASWTSLYENCKRLSEIMEDDQKRKSMFLYFGDYDPSGVDMDRHMEEAFEIFCLKGPHCMHGEIDFQRIAITREQIEQFNLPPKPEDAQTLEKWDRDSRTEGFKKEHNGELYAVELDALLALVPDDFEQLVKDSVDQYYDNDIYEQEVLTRL